MRVKPLDTRMGQVVFQTLIRKIILVHELGGNAIVIIIAMVVKNRIIIASVGEISIRNAQRKSNPITVISIFIVVPCGFGILTDGQ